MIRRKTAVPDERVKQTRGDFFRYMQGTLRQGQETAAHAVSQAGTDLKSAIQQARETVLDAEQAMAAGTKSFQEAVEKCDRAAKGASGAACRSIATGEAGVTSAMVTMIEGLKQVAEGVSQPAAVAGSQSIQTTKE